MAWRAARRQTAGKITLMLCLILATLKSLFEVGGNHRYAQCTPVRRERQPTAKSAVTGWSSDRQSDVALEHRCLELRALSALPQPGGVHDSIAEGSSVGRFAARDGARDADELGAHLIGRQSDLGIAVSSQIKERKVRSQIRIGQRPCALEVEALRIFETRTNAVPQQHVEGPVRLRVPIPVSQE